MIRKFQLFKNLIPSSSAKYLALNSSKNPSFPFPILNPTFYKIPNYSFSTSKVNNYKGDLHLLNNFSAEHKDYTSKIMDKYAANRHDLTRLTSDDIQWMFSGLYHLSLAHAHAGNHQKAYDCLFETDYIFRKLGIQDTIDVALNYYDMSSILIVQKQLEEAKEYANEASRISRLLGEDPQAKSLTVQTWHLLAQIESQTSPDIALGLYNAVLQNIGNVNESVSPAILLSVHKEMGNIYNSMGEFDKSIKCFENGYQAAKKYFGEDSKMVFNFLLEIVENLSAQKQEAIAEPYAENCLKIALRIFPNPHDMVAMIYSLLGNIYHINKKYAQAVNSFHEGLKIYEKLPEDYSALLFDVYFNMATAQNTLGLHQEASDSFTKASQSLNKAYSKPDLIVAAIYYRWANDLRLFGMPTPSKEYYWKALDLYKTLNPSNKAHLFAISSGLGQVVFSEGNSEKSLEIWKEAEEYLDPTDHDNIQLACYILDSVYSNLGKPEEAAKYFQKILQSCEATGDTWFIVENYYGSGKIHEKEGRLKDALDCYKAAAKVYEVEAKKDPAKVQEMSAKISQMKEKLQMNPK